MDGDLRKDLPGGGTKTLELLPQEDLSLCIDVCHTVHLKYKFKISGLEFSL